jgi:glycosyltransferase involved in cell wall biosynthesis
MACSLIVADGNGNECRDGVQIYDVGKPAGRLNRILKSTSRIFRRALDLNADLYQLHDPELIPIGLRLKRKGKTVVFDSHEDVPRQLLGKPYLNKPILWILSRAFSEFEKIACARLDGVIAATPFIRDKFLSINPNTVDINNFPLLNEMRNEASWEHKLPEICYVGGISKIRGIQEICRAMEMVKSDVRLNLAGNFSESAFELLVKSMSGWERVNELGFVDRSSIDKVLGRSIAGLVTLHPVINYIDALPVKMFEYMSAGIPVIASDFPLWREIVAGNDCGLLVDPMRPHEIANAIDKLVSNPDMAQRMGDNGRKAVEIQYNWQIEEQKLLRFYDRIFVESGSSQFQ